MTKGFLKILVVSSIILLASSFITAQKGSAMQDQNVWKTLSLVNVTSEYDDTYGMLMDKIEVSPIVKAMNGKIIEVDGYIIPLTGKIGQSHFMLSSLPQAICFFCGAAGPETAMQVFMKDNKKMEYSDKKVKVSGILRVNVKDAQSLLYTLEDAEAL